MNKYSKSGKFMLKLYLSSRKTSARNLINYLAGKYPFIQFIAPADCMHLLIKLFSPAPCSLMPDERRWWGTLSSVFWPIRSLTLRAAVPSPAYRAPSKED